MSSSSHQKKEHGVDPSVMVRRMRPWGPTSRRAHRPLGAARAFWRYVCCCLVASLFFSVVFLAFCHLQIKKMSPFAFFACWEAFQKAQDKEGPFSPFFFFSCAAVAVACAPPKKKTTDRPRRPFSFFFLLHVMGAVVRPCCSAAFLSACAHSRPQRRRSTCPAAL
nr:hypothetical protein [Pandoravirus belohorizontensis]